jgi:hypothetical protein
VLGVTAFAAAVVPAFDLYRNLYQVLTYDSGAPNPYIVYGPSDQLPAGLVPAFTGIGLLALAAAVLTALRGARIGPDDRTGAGGVDLNKTRRDKLDRASSTPTTGPSLRR